jgi:GTP pyrophosphokinase
MSMREIAQRLSKQYHEGQTRWDGTPYFTHPLAVGMLVETCLQEEPMKDTEIGLHFEEITCAALLHDVMEDNPDVTPEKLISAGMTPNVVNTVMDLTHRSWESYDEYILRIAQVPNQMAAVVKIADLIHNSNSLNDKKAGDKQRKQKYALAMQLVGKHLSGLFLDHYIEVLRNNVSWIDAQTKGLK